MSPKQILSALVLIASTISLTSTQFAAGIDAREVLKEHGFPGGLLPEGVEMVMYIAQDGHSFTLLLDKPCDFKVSGGLYTVSMSQAVTGFIEKRKITNLIGVLAKTIVGSSNAWTPIDTIVATRFSISFESNHIIVATFPIINFLESPVCDSAGIFSTNDLYNRVAMVTS